MDPTVNAYSANTVPGSSAIEIGQLKTLINHSLRVTVPKLLVFLLSSDDHQLCIIIIVYVRHVHVFSYRGSLHICQSLQGWRRSKCIFPCTRIWSIHLSKLGKKCKDFEISRCMDLIRMRHDVHYIQFSLHYVNLASCEGKCRG